MVWTQNWSMCTSIGVVKLKTKHTFCNNLTRPLRLRVMYNSMRFNPVKHAPMVLIMSDYQTLHHRVAGVGMITGLSDNTRGGYHYLAVSISPPCSKIYTLAATLVVVSCRVGTGRPSTLASSVVPLPLAAFLVASAASSSLVLLTQKECFYYWFLWPFTTTRWQKRTYNFYTLMIKMCQVGVLKSQCPPFLSAIKIFLLLLPCSQLRQHGLLVLYIYGFPYPWQVTHLLHAGVLFPQA